mgnify:FL=1
MLVIFYFAIYSNNLYIINYFNILDFDLFFPNIFNNITGNVFSVLFVLVIYFVILKINKKGNIP